MNPKAKPELDDLHVWEPTEFEEYKLARDLNKSREPPEDLPDISGELSGTWDDILNRPDGG
jgi:hypothetical protein